MTNTTVLYPAKISLATADVISDPLPPPETPVQGVPLGIFREVRRKDGTLASVVDVLVDPPLDVPDFAEISLWLNGVETSTRQAVVDQIMTFDLYQSELRDNRINFLMYKLHSHSGNVNESTPLWALYSANLPGGNDVPGNGDHPGLAISLPAELGDPPHIGKDEADKGVIIPLDYPYMKAYDVITLEINRERFNFTVFPDEAGKPYSALITRQMFEMVGNLDACPFSFTVVDQLKNPTHKQRWSKMIRADINIDLATLNKPILREDPNDNADDETIVDLDKLQGRPLLVVIVPSLPTCQEDDHVRATYLSTQPDAQLQLTGKITAKFGVLEPCILEVPNAQVISGSRVQVTFELLRDGKLIGTSKAATADVIGGTIADDKPAILSVRGLPSDTEIPQDSKTEETDIMLKGTASKGLTVEVLDNISDSKGLAEADPVTGEWSLGIPNLTVGPHSLVARARYGTGKSSNPRGFTVEDSGPGIEFDERPGFIDGFRHIFFGGKGFEPVAPLAGSYLDRVASGGTPPYEYSCNNDEVAFVNDNGRIYAYKNGEAEITVTDAAGKSKKFKLKTSGSFVEWKYLGPDTFSEAQKKAADAGGFLPTQQDLLKLYSIYKSAPQGAGWTWSSFAYSFGYRTLNLSTGEESAARVTDRIGVFATVLN